MLPQGHPLPVREENLLRKMVRVKLAPSTSLTLPACIGLEDLIDCPICHTFVPLDTINVHIDSGCKSTSTPSKPKQKDEWSKVFSKKTKER